MVHRQDYFGCELPRSIYISDAGIRGRDGLLTARTVKLELDQWHPLIYRFMRWGTTVEPVRQVQSVELHREAPVKSFDGRRRN
jgi:hypothetical protein